MQRRKPLWNKKVKEWTFLEASAADAWKSRPSEERGSFAFGVSKFPGKVITFLSSRFCSLYMTAKFLQVTAAAWGTHTSPRAEQEEGGSTEIVRKYINVVKWTNICVWFLPFLSCILLPASKSRLAMQLTNSRPAEKVTYTGSLSGLPSKQLAVNQEKKLLTSFSGAGA